MTKSVSELLKVTWQGDNQFDSFLTYVFIFGMGFFIACQINYLNQALKYFDSLYCVPVFQCFFIVFSTFGGFIYFREYLDFDAGNWIFFPIGIIVTVTGVYIESLRDMTGNVHDENITKKINESNQIDETTFVLYFVNSFLLSYYILFLFLFDHTIIQTNTQQTNKQINKIN